MKLLQNITGNALLRRALNLMLSTGIISLLGFVFWIIVARTNSSIEVGVATTILSSSLLIALLSQAGFDTVFIRFLPKTKDKSAYIDTGLYLSGAVAILLATAYYLLIPVFAPQLSGLAGNPLYLVLFVSITLLATWNTLTNAALIAYRETKYILIIDTIFSIVKVILPLFLASSGPIDILLAVGISQLVNVALSLAVLMIRFDYRPSLKISRAVITESKKYAFNIYISNVFKLLPDSMLPLIVIHILAASAAAHFYIAFAIANVIYTIAYAMTQVLLAESSHDEEAFGQHLRKGLALSSLMITPAIAVVAFGAPLILGIFGQSYATGATGILQIMALSGVSVMFYSFFNYSFKYTKNYRAVITMSATNAVVVLGCSAVFAHTFGLIGVGYAWMLGSVLSVLVGLIMSYAEKRNAHLATAPRIEPRQVVITHFFTTDNKGDAALLSVLIHDIKRAYPKSSIQIHTLESIDEEEKFDGALMINSLAHYSFKGNGEKKLDTFHVLYVTAVALVWSITKRYLRIDLPIARSYRRTLSTFDNADIVIPVGGGYLRGQGSPLGSIIHTITLLLPLVIAKIFSKPVLLYSQSYGPFTSKVEEKLVTHVLNTCTIGSIAREEISFKILQDMGVKNVERSIDSGFAFTKGSSTFDIRKVFNIPKKRILVGVTGKKYLKGAQHERYISELAHALDLLIVKYGIEVVFIPQVTAKNLGADDRYIHQNIYRKMRHTSSAHLLEDNLDHHTLKAAYDALDLMIGTRFHSVIFALTAKVPSIAIEYEHKTSGIMRDLDLEQWVIKIEDITSANLCHQFDRLMSGRTAYRHHLKSQLPSYVARAEQSLAYLQSYIAQHI